MRYMCVKYNLPKTLSRDIALMKNNQKILLEDMLR